MEVVAMTNRVVILAAACVLMLGVPAWQAQNSPAQDMLPQVEQPPAQEQQMQEPPAQEMQPSQQPQASQPQEPLAHDSQAQESTGQDMQTQESAAQPAQAQEDRGAMTQDSEVADAGSRHREKVSSKKSDKPVAKEALTNPVLWQDPGDVSSKDLFWGQGGQQRRPRAPFAFIREDLHGNNPKFDCRDANGKKWSVKLGDEARPEVVASRLLWAVGYFVDDNYVLPKAQVRGLKMQRKSSKQKGTTVIDARFERKQSGQQKIGTWKWRDNPFFGSREFNGLRVIMAVMNNWDLKDSNTAVYEARDRQQQFFLVSDLGSTFATTTIQWPSIGSKGDPSNFERSKFITKNDGVVVDFATPSQPRGLLAKSVGFGAMAFVQHSKMDWIGNNIPVPDAHWIGTLLGQLSHQQLVDAFRAGNFPPSEIDRYVIVMESRIHELQGL